MENKLSNIFNKAKKIVGVAVKTAQNLASPVTAFSNAAKFAWKNNSDIRQKTINNPIVKEMTAGTQAFGRNLGDALIAPFVADERNRIQKLNIDSQNKILELAKIAKNNGNMQEYSRLMGLYKNDNRVSEFAKETQKQQADWERQKKELPKNAAMTAIEIASLANFVGGDSFGLIKSTGKLGAKELAKMKLKQSGENVVKGMLKNVGRSTLFAGGLDALGQGVDVATGKQDGYDLKRGGEALVRGIGNAPLFSLTSKVTDKLLLGVGKNTPLKGALKLTDDALKASGQEAIKGNWKNVASYLAKNMTREGLLESFPETAAFYLKDQAKGDDRDVFTYFAQELPQNVISGALSTGLGMGGMNVASGKYMPKIRGKIGEALEKAVLPEEFYKMKKLTYESDPNQLTSGIDPSKLKIADILDKKELPKTAQEGDLKFLTEIENKLRDGTLDAGESGDLAKTENLINKIKTNYLNASEEQKRIYYGALLDAFEAGKDRDKFYFENFKGSLDKNAKGLLASNSFRSQETDRLDSLAQGDSEMEAKAKREQGIVEPQKQDITQEPVAIKQQIAPESVEQNYQDYSAKSEPNTERAKVEAENKKTLVDIFNTKNPSTQKPVTKQESKMLQQYKENYRKHNLQSDITAEVMNEKNPYRQEKIAKRYKKDLEKAENWLLKNGYSQEDLKMIREEVALSKSQEISKKQESLKYGENLKEVLENIIYDKKSSDNIRDDAIALLNVVNSEKFKNFQEKPEDADWLLNKLDKTDTVINEILDKKGDFYEPKSQAFSLYRLKDLIIQKSQIINTLEANRTRQSDQLQPIKNILTKINEKIAEINAKPAKTDLDNEELIKLWDEKKKIEDILAKNENQKQEIIPAQEQPITEVKPAQEQQVKQDSNQEAQPVPPDKTKTQETKQEPIQTQETKQEVDNKNEVQPVSVAVKIFQGIENKIRKMLPKDIDEKSWFEAYERGEEPKGSEKIKHLLAAARKELIENFGFNIGEQSNFLPHMKPETIDNILKNGFHVDSFGQMLAEPTFAKRRTGKLQNYEKSPRAIAAYLAQTKYYMQMSQEQKADLKLSNTLLQKYTNEKTKDTSQDNKGGKKSLLGRMFNRFQKNKESLKSDAKEYAKSQKFFNDEVDFVKEVQNSTPKEFAYDKDGNIIGEKATIQRDLKFNSKPKSRLRSILSSGIRSSLDLAENMGDDFYNAFAKGFENQNRQTVKNAIILDKMSKEQLVEYARSKTDIKNPESQDIEDLKINIFAKLYKEGKSKVISDFKKTVERTDFGDNIDQKDVVNRLASEFIGDDLKAETFFDQISTSVRKATGRATIGLNILSGVSNIWETKRAWSLTSTSAMNDALKRVASGEKFTEKYGVDSIHSTALVTKNQGKNIYKGAYAKMESERNKTGNLLNKLDPVLYKIFQTTEEFKDNMFLGAFEYQGKQKGLTGDKLEEFVIRKFNRYAVKYGKGLDTGLYRSNVIKTLFQFGQYPLKDIVILGDKVSGAVKGDKGDRNYVIKYALSSAIQYIVMRKVLGIGRKEDTDTPIDLIRNITKGELPTSPITNLVALMAYWGYKEMSGEELSEYEEILKKNQLNNATMSTFVPASVQGKKTIGGILQQARGYDLKSHGRSVANVTGDGIGNTARAVLFGKSYDSGRRDYSENIRELDKLGQTSQAGLTEKESAAFHRINENQGLDAAKGFYRDVSGAKNDKIQQTKELNDIMTGSKNAKKDILGNEVKEKGAIDKIKDMFSFGKKEKEAGAYLSNIESINDLDLTASKHISRQVTKKEELGQEISDREYEVKYLYDYNKMPDEMSSEKIRKDMEAFKIASSMDGNEYMSQEQKDHIMSKLGINNQELAYNKAAGEHDDIQSEYIRENIIAMGSQEEMMEFLINNRASVGGKQVLTDTIIGKLVNEGLIDKETGNRLKAISFVKDNDYEGDDYIMIGNAKYKPVIKQDSSNGGGSSSRTSRSDKYKAQAWGSIKNMLAKQKSINNQGINNKAVTNQYTRKNLGNILNRVSPENENTKLLSQILQETKQRRQGSKSKNNTLF